MFGLPFRSQQAHAAAAAAKPRRYSRRDILKYAAAGAGGLAIPLALRSSGLVDGSTPLTLRLAASGSGSTASPAVSKFQVPLPRPSVLQPVRSDATTDYYEITMQQAGVQILPNKTTQIWGYNGQYPGPTIIAQRGRKAVVRQINALPEPMSVHYHGGVTAPQHDGYAEDITLNGVTLPTLIRPGKEWTYEYPNQQPAATNWYHDHAVMKTAEHVYKGLAGFYLVRDELEASLGLPQGEYEVPLVFQDRRFDASGALVYDNNNHDGVVGDVQLVNGAPWPRLKVKPRKYRFRLLNGSNWRRYDLALSNGRPFVQLGTDSGFLRAPQSLPMIRLYQAERADVVIDFSGLSAGTRIVLQNRSKEAVGTPMAELMQFEVEAMPAGGSDDSRVPSRLAEYEDLTTPQAVASAVRTREFRFEKSNGMYVINGKTWDKQRFDADPRLGTTEIWKFVNTSGGWFHPIHVHLIDFQILDRKVSGTVRAPEPWERGRKDVVALGEGNEVRMIVKWDPQQYLGFTGPYMIHCHNIDHEDHDMMTQYNLQA